MWVSCWTTWRVVAGAVVCWGLRVAGEGTRGSSSLGCCWQTGAWPFQLGSDVHAGERQQVGTMHDFRVSLAAKRAFVADVVGALNDHGVLG